VRDIEDHYRTRPDLAGTEKWRSIARDGTRDMAKAELEPAKSSYHTDAGKPALTAELTDEERKQMREFFLLTSELTIFAAMSANRSLRAAQKQACDAEKYVQNEGHAAALRHRSRGYQQTRVNCGSLSRGGH
jgi:hypothetical protein